MSTLGNILGSWSTWFLFIVILYIALWIRHNSRRVWKCMKTQGGGYVETRRLTRDRAMKFVNATMGTVLYVDERHGFIFYRDGSTHQK